MSVAGLATFGQMSIFLAMLKNEQSSLDYNKCHMLIFFDKYEGDNVGG